MHYDLGTFTYLLFSVTTEKSSQLKKVNTTPVVLVALSSKLCLHYSIKSDEISVDPYPVLSDINVL